MHPLYIDVSDEVTTVIERLKSAPEGEVSLVVPKGAVLLQSIVNLKLIRKAAREAGKELTLITTDRIGRNLAAQVGIANLSHLDAPLTSEPSVETEEVVGGIKVHRYYDEEAEIEEPPAPAIEPIVPIPVPEPEPVVDDETAPITVRSFATPATPSSIEIIRPLLPLTAVPAAVPEIPKSPGRRSPLVFLALLLLLLLAGAATVGAFYWPKTLIAVSVPGKPWSKTYPSSATVGKSPDGTYLTTASFITANQNESLTFQATGSKDIGTQAHGTATLSYIQDSSSQEVPAGTVLTANGINFTTDQAVTVPGAKVVNATPTAGTANVPITASQAGTSGNMSGVPATVSGYKMYAQVQGTSGGTSQQVPVVTTTDIANAKQQLQDKLQGELGATLAKDPANHPPLSDTAKTDSFSLSAFTPTAPAGTQTASDSVTATGTAKRLVYDPNQLKASILQQAAKDAVGLANLTIDSQVTNVDLANGSIAFSSVASGVIVPAVDTELIRTQTAGKTVNNATSLIQGIVSGANVSVSQSPSWWPIKRIPYSTKYVSVRVQP